MNMDMNRHRQSSRPVSGMEISIVLFIGPRLRQTCGSVLDHRCG